MSIWCGSGLGNTPPLFVNQLVHVILRNALDGGEDPRRAARGRTVLPHPAHDPARRLADRGRRGNHRRRQSAPVSPLVSMLGIPAEAEIDVLNDDNADELLGAQRPVRHGARSHRRPRRACRARPRRCGAGSRICSASRSTIEPLDRAARRAVSPGMSGSTPTPPGSATCCGTARSSTRRPWSRVVGLFRADVPRSLGRARQGQRRAGLSDPGA